MKNININKNSNQSERKERPECSADTKLFFDDVYKSGTRGKKQQVDVLQYGRSMIEMLGGTCYSRCFVCWWYRWLFQVDDEI